MSTDQIQPNRLLTDTVDQLLAGENLTTAQAAAVLQEIMQGVVSEVQTAAFLIALRAKGETASELAGLARTMRSFATAVKPNSVGLLDTAGTGGGSSTFNVSTTAALIAAAAGCRVAKHGNRSATSRSGSADLLEALGVPLDLTPEAVADCIDKIGFGFMFAPAHHPATRYVVPVRKALAVRTVFNLLGPLTNPASASFQLIGIGDQTFQRVVADALLELGVQRALVVSSSDGLDEFSISDSTRVIELNHGDIQEYLVSPEDVGLKRYPLDDVVGGSPTDNAKLTKAVFAGERGANRDISLFNAGAAIYVAGGAKTLKDGVVLAAETVDSGRVQDLLNSYVAFANESVACQ